MWGSQALQGIAQSVRRAENKILMTEKLAAMAVVEGGAKWPEEDLREAWPTLMLSQHHDCWIVPLNAHPAGTWAKQVTLDWIPHTEQRCAAILSRALQIQTAVGDARGGERFIRVVNPISVDRREAVAVALPYEWSANHVKVYDDQNREMPCQIHGTAPRELVFLANVPSLGYATYRLAPTTVASTSSGARAERQSDGTVVVETAQYTIALDPAKGGRFKRLYDKTLRHEFIDPAEPAQLQRIQRLFGQRQRWISSADAKATLEIVENGPVRVVVTTSGKIGDHPFVSTLMIQEGQKRIEMKVRVDWQGTPLIGQRWSGNDVSRSMAKPFYDDRYKLQAVFPCALHGPVTLHKSAAFDVCQSRNDDSFFNDWHSIKHNIITHWVDLNDATGSVGFSLMSDHTTSYAFGPMDPLGLVLTYAGKGLWNRNYPLSVPSEVQYAFMPHGRTWDQAHIWGEDSRWNEPMVAQMMTGRPIGQALTRSQVRTSPGTYVTTMFLDHSALIVRLFNAEGDEREQAVTFSFVPSQVSLIELDGRHITSLGIMPTTPGEATVKLSLPRFGVRTLQIQRSLENSKGGTMAVPKARN